jgi:hypothetical protein
MLLDIRTNHERRRATATAPLPSTVSSSPTSSLARKMISGSVDVSFDTLHGWRVEGEDVQQDAAEDDFILVSVDSDDRGRQDEGDHSGVMDGEPVLRLLGRPHMLWYPASTTPSATASQSSRRHSSASSPTNACAGASAISASPHVVIIAGTEPEDGQSAVESLQRLGVAKVSMLLGGIRQLEAAAPHMVFAAP